MAVLDSLVFLPRIRTANQSIRKSIAVLTAFYTMWSLTNKEKYLIHLRSLDMLCLMLN
jgi:hypothetical protein